MGPQGEDEEGRPSGAPPGPILNVTMGVEGEKIMDFTPALCYNMEGRVPLRIRSEPGEGILMWGESRVEWTHCIPRGDPTLRFTMAIKLPGPPTSGLTLINERKLFPVKDRPDKFRFVYNSYKLNPTSFTDVNIADTTDNIFPLPVYNFRERHFQFSQPPGAQRPGGSRKQVREPDNPRVSQHSGGSSNSFRRQDNPSSTDRSGRPREQRDGPDEKRIRNDRSVSVASTQSNQSTASRNGFRVQEGQEGLRYNQDFPRRRQIQNGPYRRRR
jgi:hypothetical protein